MKCWLQWNYMNCSSFSFLTPRSNFPMMGSITHVKRTCYTNSFHPSVVPIHFFPVVTWYLYWWECSHSFELHCYVSFYLNLYSRLHCSSVLYQFILSTVFWSNQAVLFKKNVGGNESILAVCCVNRKFWHNPNNVKNSITGVLLASVIKPNVWFCFVSYLSDSLKIISTFSWAWD